MKTTTHCVDCAKELRIIKGTCPACKDGYRCLACMTKHLDAKVCKYGTTKVLEAGI